MWARAKGVEMLTVSVRDVSRREGRKVREAAQQGISVGSLEGILCSITGNKGKPFGNCRVPPMSKR